MIADEEVRRQLPTWRSHSERRQFDALEISRNLRELGLDVSRQMRKLNLSVEYGDGGDVQRCSGTLEI
jgi:hypothetical protein